MCVIISFSLWDFEILYSFLVFWRTYTGMMLPKIRDFHLLGSFFVL